MKIDNKMANDIWLLDRRVRKLIVYRAGCNDRASHAEALLLKEYREMVASMLVRIGYENCDLLAQHELVKLMSREELPLHVALCEPLPEYVPPETITKLKKVIIAEMSINPKKYV